MKLGLLTAPFENVELVEVARLAAAHDYEQLEIACWPQSDAEKRRYAGTAHLPIEKMTEKRGREIVDEVTAQGVTISGLGYYPNPLDPDPAVRRTVVAHIKKVIKAAAMMGVPIVNTFMGADPSLPLDENYRNAAKTFKPIVALAKDQGVKLCIENCPMIFSADEWPSGKNVAYTPQIWRRMFEDFDDTLGLNLDPSHLVWLMVDPERVVREFAERIYHVHIKDLEIDREGLYERTSMSMGMGWQIPRLPGLGEVDWARFVAALYRAGYTGAMVVEHEDRDFEATDELLWRGFDIARNTIRPLLPR